MAEENRIKEFPVGDWEGQLKYIYQTMMDEDKAAGRPPLTPEEESKRFNFLWEQRGQLGDLMPKLESTTPFRHDGPPQPVGPTASFASLVAPYYGENFNKELGSAVDYNNQNFPADQFGERANLPGTFPPKALRNFTPEQVDGALPLNENRSIPDVKYDSYKDQIDLNPAASPAALEYGVGQATYGNKINRDNLNFADPNEMMVGLGQAQRQHYKAVGTRLTPESMGQLLDKGDFSIFDDSTIKALRMLESQKKSNIPEDQQKYQDALTILPGLVLNQHSTAKKIFG